MSPDRIKKILVIEDDEVLLKHLTLFLESEGYTLVLAKNLAEARESIGYISSFAAVIADWSLPDGEGVSFVRELRERKAALPVIMLTARASVVDKVYGLKLGATDYMVKPFEPVELSARLSRHIENYFESSQVQGAQTSCLTSSGILIDLDGHEVTWNGSPVELTKLQYALLRFLMEYPERVFSRDELLNQVWGLERYPTTRTVDNHIVQLRQKFTADLFVTVHGFGYKFVPVR